MKKALGIIGVGLIAGVVIYVLWNKTHKTKADAVATPEKEPADNSSDNSISIINHNNLYEENDEFSKAKSSSINAMSARHEEASKIMKDAVEIIYKRSELSEDENRDLEQISDELDELLREE